MKKMFLILLLAAVVAAAILTFHDLVLMPAKAEQPDGTTVAYVVCVPKDYVNIRSKPNTRCEVIGRFEPGDVLYLDGKRRGEFLHCVGLRLETDEGWIHRGYVLYDEPELVDRKCTVDAKGRVAARKNVGGKRTKWLKPGTELTVWYWSEEWCLTNRGYVKSEYIAIDYGEGDTN